MAADFGKMIERVELSKIELDKAMAEFSQIERLTITEAYVMGHIRAGLAVLCSARDFIQQTKAYKDQAKTTKSTIVPKVEPVKS